MAHPTKEIKKTIAQAYHAGTSITQLVKIFKVHRNSIANWIKLDKKDPDLPRCKNPGSGRPPIFNAEIAEKLISIVSKSASEFGFETDFWTTDRIKRVCKEQLNLKVSKMTIHRLLVKYDHSYKKPQKKYFEASEENQNNWKKEELVQIKKIVKTKKAILYFEDESSINLSPVIAKTWGPIGRKKIQKVTGNRGSVSAISAISSSGNLLFNVHEAGKRFNAKDIIHFLDQMLLHHKRRHLVVVMDQAPCHKAKAVQDFVKSKKRLHVFYLPPRSPEFNPDEKVWSHLKHHELKSHAAKTTDELRKLAKSKLRKMSRNPRKLKGIFKRCEMADIYF
jgi:transposase